MVSTRVNKQSGAVSLFVVIFAMLIITVTTVSFLRTMTIDLSQSSDSDLSQSAYDSAEAGVEDAKRALLSYQQTCATSQSDCVTAATKVTDSTCNAGLTLTNTVDMSLAANGPDASKSGDPGEIYVQQSQDSADSALNQAYTCVKIQLQTDDYIGELSSEESVLVPLIGADDFNKVTIEWFNQDNLSTTNTDGTVELPSAAGSATLVEQDNWPKDAPSLMRAQLMQFGTSFTLNQFDYVGGSSEMNAGTLFLYPSNSTGTSLTNFSGVDIRSNGIGDNPDPDSSVNTPLRVACQDAVGQDTSLGDYACKVTINLPDAFNAPPGKGRSTAFLRLTSFYNTSNFRVQLSKNNSVVKFKDVQPSIDSTGRANDMYRRILSRVDLYDTGAQYPDATIDVTSDFCKDFSVTDVDYNAGTCSSYWSSITP